MTKKEIENTVMGDKIAEALGITPMTGAEIVADEEAKMVKEANEMIEKAKVTVVPDATKTNIRTYGKPNELIPVGNITDIPTGSDFTDVQESIRQIAELGAQKLHELGEVASASQHPRVYEAFTELLKGVVTANKELMEIKKLNVEIEKSGGFEEPSIVNNNLFVGSTKELMEQMKQLKDDSNDST